MCRQRPGTFAAAPHEPALAERSGRHRGMDGDAAGADHEGRRCAGRPATERIEGGAWSGRAPIGGVDFSSDGGVSWATAKLQDPVSTFGWRGWTFPWAATRAGEYELCARAIDAAGNAQPLDQSWNLEGVENNAVQRVRVVVGAAIDQQTPADLL